MNEAFKRNVIKQDNITLLHTYGWLYHEWVEQQGYENIGPKLDFVESEILKRMGELENDQNCHSVMSQEVQ